MATYTTAAKVKARFQDYDTDITDAQINVFINTAESFIDCVMKKSARGSNADFTFKSSLHGIIEETASVLAAFNVLTVQPTGQSGTITAARASLMGDFLWATGRRNLKFLADSRVVIYLEGLK